MDPSFEMVRGSYIRIDDQEWERLFRPYYLESRGATEHAMKSVLASLDLDPDAREATLQRARATLQLHGTDGKGTLGEAHLSMVLEVNRGIALTKAAWKETPLEVTKGFDLVGVDLEELVICLAEVKTRMADCVWQVEASFVEAAKDLRLERVDGKFNLVAGSGSVLTVSRELQRRIRENRLPSQLRLRLLEKNVSSFRPASDRYYRIGAVVTGLDVPETRKLKRPELEVRADRPCELLLLVVVDLHEKMIRLVALEEEMSRTELE